MADKNEPKVTEAMKAWMKTYRRLVQAGAWGEIVEHVRANVNLSKECLLSIHSSVQRECHRD